jgi:hypothetical protein
MPAHSSTYTRQRFAGGIGSAQLAASADKSDLRMVTMFDYVTVACFLVMAGAFLILTAREPRTLLHLLVVGAAFAIANQVGDAGYTVLAVILIIAGIVYAAMIIRQSNPTG